MIQLLRREIIKILREHDTVFGRDSRFIAEKLEDDSLNPQIVGRTCGDMDNVVSVGTKGSPGRLKWRLAEVIPE